jgi:hypothetical protein
MKVLQYITSQNKQVRLFYKHKTDVVGIDKRKKSVGIPQIDVK